MIGNLAPRSEQTENEVTEQTELVITQGHKKTKWSRGSAVADEGEEK